MGRLKRNIPDWIGFTIPSGEKYRKVKGAVRSRGLNTICLEARCPNVGDCFCRGTATFLILGKSCTRNCRYCAVNQGTPEPPDNNEPARVAEAVAELGLDFAVITSVTRDDLDDGGASFFADTIRNIHSLRRECGVEVLIPDFRNCTDISLSMVMDAQPDVINHNIEVTESFFSKLRPMGDYQYSLGLLEKISISGFRCKSGLMVGFGETIDDVYKTLEDLYNSGVSDITIGQYLQASKETLPVTKFYHPDEFKIIENYAGKLGFKKVLSGPMVRSSYHAGEEIS